MTREALHKCQGVQPNLYSPTSLGLVSDLVCGYPPHFRLRGVHWAVPCGSAAFVVTLEKLTCTHVSGERPGRLKRGTILRPRVTPIEKKSQQAVFTNWVSASHSVIPLENKRTMQLPAYVIPLEAICAGDGGRHALLRHARVILSRMSYEANADCPHALF